MHQRQVLDGARVDNRPSNLRYLWHAHGVLSATGLVQRILGTKSVVGGAESREERDLRRLRRSTVSKCPSPFRTSLVVADARVGDAVGARIDVAAVYSAVLMVGFLHSANTRVCAPMKGS
mmetsp:Transcript_10728/g.35201  ORF Transcript_10728/g.35201 Transcript_10728/m.35201 type:complete len:120 (+) Transcript_10728:1149-1508(+)